MAKWREKAANNERWGEADGRAAVEAWRASGDSIAAFARDCGVDPQRLGWWRKRLNESSSTSLIPVTITNVPAPVGVRVHVDDVEIEVADPSRVSASWVAELVASVRGGAR